MKRASQVQTPNAEIEEVEIIYDMSLGIGNEPSCGIDFEVLNNLTFPEEPEYAAVTKTDRMREKKAYPVTGRVEPTPTGQDLDLL